MAEASRLAALNDRGSCDFSYEKNPRCPHCGETCRIEDQEWWHLFDEGEHEVECPHCDLQFTVSTRVTHHFSTDEQEDRP